LTVLDQLERARRVLCIGIGGGGDVAGAHVAGAAVTPELVLGGISWERRTLDGLAGPRAIAELRDADPFHWCGADAGPTTRGPGDLLFSEALLSAHLGGQVVVLIDCGEGSGAAGEAIVAAADRHRCDAVILLDVGGDVLARGDESTLASPLADALMLATAPAVSSAGLAVLAGILGPGCDGELPAEAVQRRLALLSSRVAVLEVPSVRLDDLEEAARAVRTEATLMVLHCARGIRGTRRIRASRPVQLTAAGGRLYLFDAIDALSRAAPLARTVAGARTIEEAHGRLLMLGVPSELGWPGQRWSAPAERREARQRQRGKWPTTTKG
jgi:hypothetical protein